MRAGFEFDEPGLLARVARASAVVLRRMGAYVRTVARRKVRASPEASPAGQPPHTRRGLLRRSVIFGYDRLSDGVVIGPSERLVGTSMAAHEFGGAYRRERYPKRPLMGPALRESAPHLARMWESAVS